MNITKRQFELFSLIIFLLFAITITGWWYSYSKLKMMEEKIALDKKYIERQSKIIMQQDSIIGLK